MSNSISPISESSISGLPQETLQHILSFNPLNPLFARINHQFHDAYTGLLIQNIRQIFEHCSTGQATLNIFINSLRERCQIADSQGNYPDLDAAGVNRLHQLIVQKIQNFGIACPDKYLSSQEIHGYIADITPVEDRNLQIAWDGICREISAGGTPLLNLPAVDAPAAAIRTWMNANAVALHYVYYLNLSHSQLTCIPREIALLTGLYTLYLGFNRIRELPVEIFNALVRLQRLQLNNNQISELPVGIFNRLVRLERIDFSANQIGDLPVRIFNGLVRLQNVNFSCNQISKLPVEIFNGLVSLQEIDFCYNQIKELTVKVFNGLNLEKISFYQNQIKELPVEIFNGLARLKELDLRNNQIRELPVEIFNGLAGLQTLDLANNQISELPVEIFNRLVRLQLLYLNGNPQLLAFYKELQAQDSDLCKNIFNAFHQYACRSAFASFYQFAAQEHTLGEVIAAFHVLDQGTRNAIYGMVYEEAGRPTTDDLQWGEHHAFDDKGIFNGALKRYVRGRFDALSESQKNAVYGRVRELAQADPDLAQEVLSNPNWGCDHAEDNVLRLIDAMLVIGSI